MKWAIHESKLCIVHAKMLPSAALSSYHTDGPTDGRADRHTDIQTNATFLCFPPLTSHWIGERTDISQRKKGGYNYVNTDRHTLSSLTLVPDGRMERRTDKHSDIKTYS